MAQVANKAGIIGTLADAMRGADILIGVSKPGIVTQDMIRSMAKDPIVFVMSNPTPEIMPDLAKEAGAAVVGTGRSDFPNQVNNVIAFPGIFRGALDARASRITEEMKEAAARAIAAVIPEEELTADYVLPDPFNPLIVERISDAIKACDRFE
jgi:malate dehydrogenase (oxaloacetate-decarboxylating)